MVYRNDRNSVTSSKSRGGGVMIAVNKKIISSPIYTDDPAVEHLFIKMVVGDVTLIMGAVYLPLLYSKATFERHIQVIDDIVLRNPTSG